MANLPDSYTEAIGQAQALLRIGRLADPGEHFPYRHEQVSALIADNPPMGPDGEDDDTVRAEDFISQDIADATRDYIEAQAAYLTDPGDATAADYDGAKAVLQQARAAHRANRGGATIVGVRARRAGE